MDNQTKRIDELTIILEEWDTYWTNNKYNLIKQGRMTKKQKKYLCEEKSPEEMEKYNKNKERINKNYWKRHFQGLLFLNKRLKRDGIQVLINEWKKERTYGYIV